MCIAENNNDGSKRESTVTDIPDVWQNNLVCKNVYILITTAPMAIRLGSLVNYPGGLLTINSFNALITWSCKFT